MKIKNLFKKVTIPVMVTALLLPTLPLEVSASHSQGILYGKTLDYGSAGATSLLTDGDHTTHVDVGGSTKSVEYTFSNSKSIDTLYVDIVSKDKDGDSVLADLNVNLYDSNDNLLHTETLTTTGEINKTISTTVDNVSRIEYISHNGELMELAEVDVYNTIDYTSKLLDSSYISTNDLPVETYDNDSATGFQSSGSSTTSNIELTEEMDFTDMYSNINGSTTNITVKMYDSAGTLLGTENPSNGQQSISYQSVKSLSIYQPNDGSVINELDFDATSSNIDTTPPGEVLNLTQDTNTNGDLGVTYSLPTDSDFDHINVYKNGTLTTTSTFSENTWYSSSAVIGDVIKVSTVDTTGNESTGQTITLQDSSTDTIAPGEVTDLNYTTTTTSVNFDWVMPTDQDFSHVNIYQDSTQIATTVTTNVYEVTGLTSSTSYDFKITTVDTNGNESTGVIQTITTGDELDSIAPAAPTNVNVNSLNEGLSVTWSENTETDLSGYNVYLDGVKQNTDLISNEMYNITSLTNGTSYDLQVSAVDTSGNESTLTTSVTGTPSENAMPIFQLGYDLEDVATGTASWFSSLWLIIAFSVAIPLSFLIANRIKGLFTA